MAIGTQAMTVYQGDDVNWEFDFTDDRVDDISDFGVIEAMVKETAAEPNPPLIGPSRTSPSTGDESICAVVDTLKYSVKFNANLTPGVYIYSVRREDPEKSWQMAQAALTVLDSASKD